MVDWCHYHLISSIHDGMCLPVRPFIGVGAEAVALCLDQVGSHAFRGIHPDRRWHCRAPGWAACDSGGYGLSEGCPGAHPDHGQEETVKYKVFRFPVIPDLFSNALVMSLRNTAWMMQPARNMDAILPRSSSIRTVQTHPASVRNPWA